MPNLGLHIGFALDCGRRLGHPIVDEHRGTFLFGSTTPDIRLFAGWERERTHFFHLTTDPCGVGVEGMLETHPHLRHSERLSRTTIAFMLGYMTHLHTDERWIVQIFRRYFGEGSELSKDPLVQVLDRAFQFELDRQERQNIFDLESAIDSMRNAANDVDVGFIDQELLTQWQGIAIDRVGRELPWERFKGMVQRVRRNIEEAELERTLATVPDMIRKVRDHIPESEILAFREAAIQDFVIAAGNYLEQGQVT